jgi:hypothetical protein
MNMFKILAAAVVIAVSFVGAAQASGDLSPADNAAMHSYVLSMDKINGMGAATGELKAMEKSNPALAKDAKAIGDSSKSIGEMVSKVNADPQLIAIYKKHGLNATDAVVMPFVLMYSAMCVQYPEVAVKLAAQTSPAQIAFYKAHKAELAKQTWLSGK